MKPKYPKRDDYDSEEEYQRDVDYYDIWESDSEERAHERWHEEQE